MLELREFIYLDTAKLHTLVSQIQGGIISEINETIKQIGGVSAGLNIGLPPFGGKVDASKNKESEHQQTIRLTDPAYFNVLHQYLIKNDNLTDITAASFHIRENLNVGQFVEIECRVEPPVVDNWIDQARSLFDFINKNMKLFSTTTTSQKQSKGRTTPPISNQQMTQFKAILDFMVDYINLSKKDPGKQYIRGISDKQQFNTWYGLIPDFIVSPLHSALPSEFRIFGRIERILGEGETWKIVDFSYFSQNAQAEQLINVLNSFSAIFGQRQISIADLQAQYPDVIITPIALYR